jgi:hypothetical protein
MPEILRDLEAVRDWSPEFWRQFETAGFATYKGVVEKSL